MSITIGDWVFEHAVYDSEVDVLYLAVDGPREGYGEETPEGDIARFDDEGQFCGITLIGIRRRLQAGDVTITLPRIEHVGTAELEAVLA